MHIQLRQSEILLRNIKGSVHFSGGTETKTSGADSIEDISFDNHTFLTEPLIYNSV